MQAPLAPVEMASPVQLPTSASSSLRSWLVLSALLSFIFFLFLPTLRFEFVYDDKSAIVLNPTLQSLTHVGGFFSHDVWGHAAGSVANYYRPLHLLWMAINYACFDLEPAGW